MKAFADSVAAAYGVVCISNEIHRKSPDDPRMEIVRPFIDPFYKGAVPSQVGRRETLVSDILRGIADAVDAMPGNFEDWHDANFLADILEGVGRGLKEGVGVSQNSIACAKAGEARKRSGLRGGGR